VFDQILPSSVAVVATREDIEDVTLFPEEAAIVERAVDKRRREFTTGRACARAALTQLGLEPQAIPTGPRGAPQWPNGVVGSITHCDGLRASAVARTADLATVGIDAERNEPLPVHLLGDIAMPEERPLLEMLAREDPRVCWDRLLFCAKEAVYKAWFPLAERWLGFEDAIVTFDRVGEAFSARLLVSGPTLNGHELTGFTGRWLVRDGFVLAAIALPRSA
jgi:4'-phosphopantetheinyl transferase EntD